MKAQNALFSALMVIVAMISGCEGGSDSIVINNKSGSEVGVVVDGQYESGTRLEDSTFLTTDPTVLLTPLVSSGQGNNVIGFNKFRPVRYEQANWTSKGNILNLDFQDEIEIGIKVWVVWGPFNKKKNRSIDACIWSQQIFDDERCGVRIKDFDVEDKTSMNNRSDFFHFDTNDNIADWQNGVGFDAEKINIYWIKTVSGSTSTGRAVSFGQSIVLGRTFPAEPVMHEICHTMSLRHTGGVTNFNSTGIMNNTYSRSSPTLYLTEGQNFRMHTEQTSSINTVFSARPGEPTTNCIGNVSNSTCIDQDLRFWADGTLPANF